MADLKLTYFDFHGGRGEPARLACHIGKVNFTDDRFAMAQFAALKAGGSLPFGAVPVLTVDGRVVSQSNAINRYLGSLAGLYPKDSLQALYCDEILEAVEDVSGRFGATFGIADRDELKKAREAFTAGPLTTFLKGVDKILKRAGDYVADSRMTVGDLALFSWVKSLKSGNLDFIPTDTVATVAPEVDRHYQRVRNHKDIAGYYEKFGAKIPE